MSRLVRVEVVDAPLSAEEHRLAVDRADAGAVAVFSGVVRDHDGGRSVRELEYEAHPTAAATLRAVAEEVLAAEPEIRAVAVSHRVGALTIGDIALVAAVSSAHRAESFRALELLVEQVKARIPVWKRQVFADGTDEWVNSA